MISKTYWDSCNQWKKKKELSLTVEPTVGTKPGCNPARSNLLHQKCLVRSPDSTELQLVRPCFSIIYQTARPQTSFPSKHGAGTSLFPSPRRFFELLVATWCVKVCGGNIFFSPSPPTRKAKQVEYLIHQAARRHFPHYWYAANASADLRGSVSCH